MYHRIIVAMSLEHGLAEAALALARRLRAADGEIVALHVHEQPRGSVGAYLDEATVQAAFAASKAALQDRIAGQDGVQSLVLKGHAGQTILDQAGKIGADCIIVGSHKPGLADFFLGSTAARIVRHAPCSVHVLRP